MYKGLFIAFSREKFLKCKLFSPQKATSLFGIEPCRLNHPGFFYIVTEFPGPNFRYYRGFLCLLNAEF